MDIEKAIKYFNVFTGENAIGHLLKVACGIDSMVLGEDEILRQVKESYYFAMENIMFQEINSWFFQCLRALFRYLNYLYQCAKIVAVHNLLF